MEKGKERKEKMSKEMRSYRKYLKGLFRYQSAEKAVQEADWHLQEDYGTMMNADWEKLNKFVKSLYKKNSKKR